MKRLLLTSFEPFLGETVNPSEKLIQAIHTDPENSWIDTLVLPVSFKRAPEVVFQSLNLKNYDFILMLGQAGGRAQISLERAALNWVETDHPDQSGYTPKTGLIDSTAEKAFFSTWPLHKLKKELELKKIPVEISFSAGAFVCNYLYYKITAELSLMKKPCLFVHVPYLPEQASSKKEMPSMEFSVMKAGLMEILNYLKNNSF